MHTILRRQCRLLNVLAGMGVLATAQALAAPATPGENPYLVVAERNMFDLKPIPKPEDLAPPPPPAPPTKITLQGITVLFGRKEVLLKIPEPPAPGQPPKERSLILGEGERHGPIEVVRIDPVAREVEFRDSGNPVKLKLTDFIAKTPAPPATPAAPGVARPTTPVPAANLPRPGPAVASAPGSTPTVIVGNPSAQITTGTPSAGTPVQSPAANLPGFPSRPVRTAPANPNPQSQLSLEEQIVLIELQRQATQEQVNRGLMPPLPPTELTPPGAVPPPVPPAPNPGAPPVPPMPGN